MTHTIELHPLQAKALRDGATVLLLKMNFRPPDFLKVDRMEVVHNGKGWVKRFYTKDGQYVGGGKVPYAPGDVLTVCPCCDESVEGTCPKVTVRDIKPMRAQEPAAHSVSERAGFFLGAPHRIKGTPKVFYLRWQAAADLFDAIHGEGAYEANAWYWRVEVEA